MICVIHANKNVTTAPGGRSGNGRPRVCAQELAPPATAPRRRTGHRLTARTRGSDASSGPRPAADRPVGHNRPHPRTTGRAYYRAATVVAVTVGNRPFNRVHLYTLCFRGVPRIYVYSTLVSYERRGGGGGRRHAFFFVGK